MKETFEDLDIQDYDWVANDSVCFYQQDLAVLKDFIELALNSGCRKGELLHLKWTNIDFTARLIRLENTKSGEWQTVPIN